MLIDVTNPITDWIFPKKCLVCYRDVTVEHICASCQTLCLKYPNNKPFIHSDWNAIFYYEFAIKKLVINAKFNRNLTQANLLIRLVDNSLESSNLIHEINEFSPSIITYVPTHWLNRVMRGIDLPELFAQWLSKKLKVPCEKLLVRKGFYSRQVFRLTKTERKMGIKGSLLAKTKASYARILLVDDIVTTGATFDESRKILKEPGRDIRCIAIARTP
jgi:predicted amidophosphoribosyltransferase